LRHFAPASEVVRDRPGILQARFQNLARDFSFEQGLQDRHFRLVERARDDDPHAIRIVPASPDLVLAVEDLVVLDPEILFLFRDELRARFVAGRLADRLGTLVSLGGLAH
jgi:hypothetical protein